MSTTGPTRVHLLAAFFGIGCATNLNALAAHSGHAFSTQDNKDVTSRSGFTSSLPDTRLLFDMSEKGSSIAPIDIPFVQKPSEWQRPGKGISMDSTGEPKSGTTWTERILTFLVLYLCGSSTNTWCQMGGLQVIPNKPAPSYRWETFFANTGELFMHFEGLRKHPIPGFNVGLNCNPNGRTHRDCFEEEYPCLHHIGNITREDLRSCLPDTSMECAKLMPSTDPSVTRMVVVFRDPRDVVISERRMRTGDNFSIFANVQYLNEFIHKRFQTILAWQHQRWVWHKTFYSEVSHVMFYEDLQATSSPLVDLAAFIGLSCSEKQARHVWAAHTNVHPHGSFHSYGLSRATVEWMNRSMSSILPSEMLSRWGLPPPDH